jgi:hypothetical protein
VTNDPWVTVKFKGRDGWEERARIARETDDWIPAPSVFEDEVLVATVPLTEKTELRLRLQTWKGERRIDVRVFNHYVRKDEWGPTQRGVSLPIERAGDLLEAVRELHEAAKRERRQ